MAGPPAPPCFTAIRRRRVAPEAEAVEPAGEPGPFAVLATLRRPTPVSR
jgi:hypothetical protein